MKAIRLKEKGKEPVVLNTIDKLAEYWHISKGRASNILSILKEYQVLIERFNIETIEECDEFEIPQHYIEQGFKRIPVEGKHNYIINKDGVVINVANDRILKPRPSNNGYLIIRVNGKGLLIHRLVAKLFVPNPNHFPIINHINEDKTDNRAENLEWCSYEYNSSYGSLKCKVNSNNSIPIVVTKNGEEKLFSSLKEASRETGVDTKSIRECLRGVRKSAKGFIFKKIKEK